MKRIYSTFLILSAGSVLLWGCHRDSENDRYDNRGHYSEERAFKEAKKETIQGEIVDMRTLGSQDSAYQNIQLSVRTDKGVVPVDLGPSWFVQSDSMRLQVGDHVKIEGFVLRVQDYHVFVARTLKLDGYELKLRNSKGQPRWYGWRKS